MKQAEVSVGSTYVVKVSGHLVPVRLDSVCEYGKGWEATNKATGRHIRIRSAAKLRRVFRSVEAPIIGPVGSIEA